MATDIMNNKTKIIKVLVALIMALTLSACSDNKTAQEHISEAETYKLAHNFSAEIIELKSAVRLEPKNGGIRFKLAKAYQEQGNYILAEKEFEKGLELGVESASIIPELAFIKWKLNKTEDVYKLLKQGNSLNDDIYIRILTYAGITALSNGDHKKAQDLIGQANLLNEDSIYSKIASAYQSYSINELTGSLSITNEILAEFPNFSEALLLKAHLLFAQEQYQHASTAYAEYRQSHPFAHFIRFFEVNSLLLAEDYEKADSKISELIKLSKDNPLSNQYKAQLEYHKENYSEAKSYADIAAQHGNRFLVAKMIAGISAYQLEDFEQAYNNLLPLEKSLPTTHPVKKILAVIKIKLGYTAEAAETLNDLENLTATDSEFLQASSIELMKAGDFETAKNLIEKASQVAPENAIVAAQKGLLLLSQQDLAGIKSLEKAVQLDPSMTDIEMSLAMQYLANGQQEKAELIAAKWVKSQQNKVLGFLLQGFIEHKQNLSTKAKASFTKVLELDPENISALYQLAIMADNEAKFSEAINLYQKVVNNYTSHTGAIQRLSQLQVKQKNVEENVEYLSLLLAKNPSNIPLILGLAQNLRLNNELSKAISLLESKDVVGGINQSYWLILGDSYLQSRDFKKAQETFNKLLQLNSNNYVAHLRIIGLYEQEQNYEQGLKATEIALKKFGDDARLLMLRANFEFLTLDKSAAQATLNNLKSKGVKHFSITKLAGELALSDKDYPQAIEYFNNLYAQRSTPLNVMLLARALKFNGQPLKAAETLELYLNGMEKAHQVRMLLAELYMQFNENRAIEHLEIINDAVKDNVVVLNNLAWLELKHARKAKALIYAKKAFELKSDAHQILDTYGAVLVSVKDFDTAITILESALENGSRGELTYLNLSKAYLTTGNVNKVKVLLKKIEDKEISAKVLALL